MKERLSNVHVFYKDFYPTVSNILKRMLVDNMFICSYLKWKPNFVHLTLYFLFFNFFSKRSQNFVTEQEIKPFYNLMLFFLSIFQSEIFFNHTAHTLVSLKHWLCETIVIAFPFVSSLNVYRFYFPCWESGQFGPVVHPSVLFLHLGG